MNRKLNKLAIKCKKELKEMTNKVKDQDGFNFGGFEKTLVLLSC